MEQLLALALQPAVAAQPLLLLLEGLLLAEFLQKSERV
jgi:hypothetical protein